MKLYSLVKQITGLSIVLGATLTMSQKSYAESTKFACKTHENVRATIAHTIQGEIPIFFWRSGYFSPRGYTPDRRCIETSRKLQTHYNKGTLNYIFATRINHQLVVCVASSENGACLEELFTLNPNYNIDRILQSILAIRDRNLGRYHEDTDRVYININEYLNTVDRGISPFHIINEDKPVESWLYALFLEEAVDSYLLDKYTMFSANNSTGLTFNGDFAALVKSLASPPSYLVIEDFKSDTNQQFDFSDSLALSRTSTKLAPNSDRLFDDIINNNNGSFLSQLDTSLELLYSDSYVVISMTEIDFPEDPKAFDEPGTVGLLIVAVLIFIGYKR